MRSAVDPEGRRLPIKLDSTSNGEFVPVPLSSANHEANRLAHAAAERNARAAGYLEKKLPGVRLRRRLHAPCLQRGERRRGAHGRVLRPAAGSGARAPGRALGGGPGRIHLRRAGPLHRHAQGQLQGPGRLHQGRVPRLRHRHDGAVLRALATRRRAGDHPGGGRRAQDRGEAGRHPSPAPARPRQSQPAGRPGGHGRAGGPLGRLGVEDLHAVRPRRARLLPHRRRGHPLRGEGARARREGDLHPQGAALRLALLRAQPVLRHRPHRQALSRREVPHLPLRLRHRPCARRPTTPLRSATASTP